MKRLFSIVTLFLITYVTLSAAPKPHWYNMMNSQGTISVCLEGGCIYTLCNVNGNSSVYAYSIGPVKQGSKDKDFSFVYEGSQAFGKTIGYELVGNRGILYAGLSEGVAVIDLQNQTMINRYGILESGGPAKCLAIAGDRLYVGTNNMLRVFDLNGKPLPTLLGSTRLAGIPRHLAIAGDIIYVTEGGAGVEALTITDPANISQAFNIKTRGAPHGIAVVGDAVYLTDDFVGLQVVSAKDREETTASVAYEAGGLAGPITVFDELLVVGSVMGRGNIVFSLADPIKPQLQGRAYYDVTDSVSCYLEREGKLYSVNNSYATLVDVAKAKGKVRSHGTFDRAKKAKGTPTTIYVHESFLITRIDETKVKLSCREDLEVMGTFKIILPAGTHDIAVNLLNYTGDTIGTGSIAYDFLEGQEYFIYPRGRNLTVIPVSEW